MLEIVLSERDFDYELMALLNSFFPGHKSHVSILGEIREDVGKKLLEEEKLRLEIAFGWTEIQVTVCTEEYEKTGKVTVSGEEDWHRHEDKSAHPYRAYYKNELKRLVFRMLCEIPEENLAGKLDRRVPDWGTMTGVRPTKIPMNELLAGKSRQEVEESLRKWYCCKEDKLELCMDIALREAKLLEHVDFEQGYSLYIGIPFCPTTCLYCSFPSYPWESFGNLAEEYLQALMKEIRQVARQCAGRRLTSVYIGGGTPTTLSAEELGKLLSCVRQCFPAQDSYECTVEAGRPDSITREKLQVLRDYGVDRISVNPQTMQQKTLDYIGRKHTVEQTKEAFLLGRELGFRNINMDLIIGLPGETPEDFADTLQQVKVLSPDSITIHSLVIKRASRLRSLLEEAGDFAQTEKLRQDGMEQMLAMGREFAAREGYRPYYMYRQKNSAGHFGSSGQENIGFARPGKECLYNILIMEEMQTIVAVGAGASTKCYHPEKKIVSRIENVKSITDYISRIDEMIERKQGIFPGKR